MRNRHLAVSVKGVGVCFQMPDTKMENKKSDIKALVKEHALDLAVAVTAGLIVSLAYFFFQNSNNFAPGGVGGLATITYHMANLKDVPWAYFMLAFNLPIFILVTIFVNRKLGVYLIIYMLVQSFGTMLWEALGWVPYCELTYGDDFEIVFACILTGVISGAGFSIMLRHFGASGGTYAISALLKRANPGLNIAYVAFLLDSSVVAVAFFVYGMKITPTVCTLINLFVANIVVDNLLSGVKVGYKFEIITDHPEEIAAELMEKLERGVTEMRVEGMYTHSKRYMLVCIISKKQIGETMKILKRYPGSFASYSKVNEIFGRFIKK